MQNKTKQQQKNSGFISLCQKKDGVSYIPGTGGIGGCPVAAKH